MGRYSDTIFAANRTRKQMGYVSVPVSQTTTPDPKLKGVKGGNCNRTACQAPGAFAWSMNNHAYYCDDCARMLNREPSNHAYWKANYGVDRFVFRPETLTPEEIALWKAKNGHLPEGV